MKAKYKKNKHGLVGLVGGKSNELQQSHYGLF